VNTNENMYSKLNVSDSNIKEGNEEDANNINYDMDMIDDGNVK